MMFSGNGNSSGVRHHGLIAAVNNNQAITSNGNNNYQMYHSGNMLHSREVFRTSSEPGPIQASCGESNMLDDASESDLKSDVKREEVDSRVEALNRQKMQLK